jgi:hypothetical protein
MYEERREIVSTLQLMPVTLAALIRSVDDRRGAVRHGSGWAISEIVCHLFDAEQRTYERILRIRDEDRPDLPIYPDDEYSGRSLSSALSAFTVLRREHVRLLGAIDVPGWLRTGLHEREGELSILDIARHTIAHDGEHLAQVATELSAAPHAGSAACR